MIENFKTSPETIYKPLVKRQLVNEITLKKRGQFQLCH